MHYIVAGRHEIGRNKRKRFSNTSRNAQDVDLHNFNESGEKRSEAFIVVKEDHPAVEVCYDKFS